MRKERNFIRVLTRAFAYMFFMILIGMLLVMAQTFAVRSGRLTIELNLSMAIHFISAMVIGVIASVLVKENEILSILIAMGAIFLLMLFVSIVVFDGMNTNAVGSMFGGAAGATVSIIASFFRKRKTHKWKVK